jgi:hypothetical protein
MNIFKKTDSAKKGAPVEKNEPPQQPVQEKPAESQPKKAEEEVMDVRSLKSGDYFLHVNINKSKRTKYKFFFRSLRFTSRRQEVLFTQPA